MSRPPFLQQVSGLLLIMGVLVGCLSTLATPVAEVQTATDTPAQAAATPTRPRQPPDGTYTTTITAEELTSLSGQGILACENAGTFTLTVTGDRWSISQAAAPGCSVQDPSITGSWAFAGEQVTFHADQSLGCPQTYTYQWRLEGTALRFTAVEDSCPPRVAIQSTHPWLKQP